MKNKDDLTSFAFIVFKHFYVRTNAINQWLVVKGH